MMKYNAGEDALNAGIASGSAFAIPNSANVTIVSAGSGSCMGSSSKYCCWVGTTSAYCDLNDGNYSGCTRTVCDWRAANSICSKITYLSKT